MKYTKEIIYNGELHVVEIRLSDPCKNGHQDFAATMDTYSSECIPYESTKIRDGKKFYHSGGGCQHDLIVKIFPELKTFVDLHLCDFNGAPMYPEANGFYHIQQDNFKAAKNMLRVTDKELEELKQAEDKTHFKFLLESLGIIKRWKQEAKKAIKNLEKLTGEKFANTSTRSQYEPLAAKEKASIKKRIAEGFYSPDAIAERKEAKRVADGEKIIKELQESAQKKIDSINGELAVHLEILACGLPLNNFIYYNHSNKGVFNWKGYDEKITPEQFDKFTREVDVSRLPKGIGFQLGKDD